MILNSIKIPIFQSIIVPFICALHQALYAGSLENTKEDLFKCFYIITNDDTNIDNIAGNSADNSDDNSTVLPCFYVFTSQVWNDELAAIAQRWADQCMDDCPASASICHDKDLGFSRDKLDGKTVQILNIYL